MGNLEVRKQAQPELDKEFDLQGIEFIHNDEARFETTKTWFPESEHQGR